MSDHALPAGRLPIKLDTTSNGEFEPVPLNAAALYARERALAALHDNQRRLATSRRAYLTSLVGAAATLSAFNEAFAAAGQRGGSYALPKEAPFELAAARTVLASDDFIFDVQLHHVNPKGAWRQRAGPNAFRSMPNSNCGKADHVECFSSGALLKDVFHDSDTAMGVLSHVPGGMQTNPLDFDAASATRAAANALDNTQRLLLHGRCMPTLPGEIDGMDAQAAQFPVAAFKTYTQFGPADGAAGFYLDDDRFGTPFIERARKLGVKNIAVHKGLAFGARGYEYSTARDIGPVAKRHPHVRSMQDAGNPRNVYAELGSTWRFVMRDPDQAAHLLGKLLKTFGEDRVLWGTDSIWYGSPQDQILAFRAFQISNEFQQRFGYPALTPELKRKVFGLNAARVYGLKPDELRTKLAKDRVQKSKLEYLNDPRPTFATYGPRTRREWLAFKSIAGDAP
jgi:hypothetical protein